MNGSTSIDRPPEDRPPRLATPLLALSMFLTGACGLIAEYVMGTVSSYLLGNSIEQMSITFGVMLFSMGIASHFQRYIRDTFLLEKFIGLEILIALASGFAPIILFAAFSVVPYHFYLVQYSCMGTIGFLIGLEIPLVTRINEAYQKELKTNLASIFSMDYLGSFAGSLVWVYFLLRYLPITQIGFVLAFANLLVAFAAFAYFSHLGLIRKRLAPGLAMALTAIALPYGYFSVLDWNESLEQRLYDDPIVLSTTTRYQHLVVTHDPLIEDYRFFINGNLQFSSYDEAIYHEQLVHPVMTAAPRRSRVLILGGGDGMALREVLKYGDVKDVTLVDLDPEVTRLFAEHPLLSSLNDHSLKDGRVRMQTTGAVEAVAFSPVYQDEALPNAEPSLQKVADVEIFNVDADKFVEELRGIWDVVIIDFPDPNAIELVKLYSKQFYLKLRRVVAEDGLAVVQATSPYHAKEAFLCILRTLEAAGWSTLPYHDNVPSFGDWGWIIMSKHPFTPSVKARFDALPLRVPTRYLTREVFASARTFGKGRLTASSDAINTLQYPALLYLYSKESWLAD